MMSSGNNLNEINDIEFLKRLVRFYEQALLFYSKKINYEKTIESNLPLIMIDGGNQANYALETVKKLSNEHKSVVDEYDDIKSHIDDLIKKKTKE